MNILQDVKQNKKFYRFDNKRDDGDGDVDDFNENENKNENHHKISSAKQLNWWYKQLISFIVFFLHSHNNNNNKQKRMNCLMERILSIIVHAHTLCDRKCLIHALRNDVLMYKQLHNPINFQ